MFSFFKKKQPQQDNSKNGVDNGKKTGSNSEKKKDYEKEIEKNIIIYTMPKRFRIVHKEKVKAKTIGIVIILGGAVFFIASLALLYYYFVGSKKVQTTPVATSTSIITEENGIEGPAVKKKEPEADSSVEQISVKGPKESYIEIKAEFDKVADFDNFERVIRKYGSVKRIAEFEKEKKQAEGMSESFKENIVSLVVQQSMPKLSEIGDISAKVEGDIATLSVTTKERDKQGTVIMVLENGVWKLESESWSDAVAEKDGEAEPTSAKFLGYVPGTDSDNDGLTDKEEFLLNSDLNSDDTDGDGYADLSEVVNLYNPNGEGKLEDSKTVKRYVNNTYSYSLIYPANWSVNKIGEDDSIIFKSGDNHFIQVVVQTNTNIQSIEEWYKSQFNESVISNDRLIEKSGWRGIKNEDGLTIYLTDSEYIYIYTITYNPGNNKKLEYRNIFEMIVNSFEINSNQ
jgi:hypothetical protein